MYFDAVIFDFDYTLADGTDAIVGCYNYAFSRHGYPDGGREEIRRTVGMTVRDSIRLLTGCRDEAKIEEMRLDFRRKADEILVAGTHLYKDTFPLLKAVRAAGGRTAIVSSKEKFRIDEDLENEGAEGLVDLVIGVSSAPEPKPSPVGVLMAAKTLGSLHPLYVGDSLIDFETAKNAGFPFAAVTTGTTTKSDFERANADGAVRFFGIFDGTGSLREALMRPRTLYVSDIDGTIKQHGEPIPDETSRLLSEAQKRGAYFTVATARGISSALYAMCSAAVNAPLICLSGAELYDTETEKITRRTVPDGAARAAWEAAAASGADIFVYLPDAGKTITVVHPPLITEAGKRFEKMRASVEGQHFVEKTVCPAGECLYIVSVGDEASSEKVKSAAEAVSLLSGERFSESLSGAVYTELFSENGGKGKTAQELKEQLFAERLVTFGDNLNDLSMMKYADEFHTVEGALNEVTEAADSVLCGENAVARFIARREGVFGCPFSVSDASDSELKKIAELDAEAFSGSYSEKQLAEMHSMPEYLIIVAHDGNDTAGYLIATLSQDGAEIFRIFVKKSLRGLKIASLLHREFECRARAAGADRLLLEVRSKNPAVEIYNHLGYKKDGLRRGYYRCPDDDALLMSRKL